MKRIFIVLLLFVSVLLVFLHIDGEKTIVENRKIVNNLVFNQESVSYDESDNYDITILVEINYDQCSIRKINVNNEEDLNIQRNIVKEYFQSHNENIASKMRLNCYKYSVSYYAPFIEIVFDNLSEYNRVKEDLIDCFKKSEYVQSASINYIGFNEANVNSSASSSDYSFSDAINDIGASSLSYTGNGVKVGTIEPCSPNTTVNLKTGKYTILSSNTDSHSTWVTSIIGGNTGIAENAYLYITGTSGSCFTSRMNDLISNNVNIINMSAWENNNGFYDNYCKYIDYVVQSTYCTFVKSSGNNGPSTQPKITSPGCGMNVITVGSIAKDKNVSYFSSWYTSNDYLLKPDMVAPGERISNIPNLSGNNSGTSFAAPMVTGIVALLMEEFPSLKLNPSLVKTALQNGCEKLPSQTDYFDEQCGFGLVNYSNARTYLSNSQYNNFNIPMTAANGNIVASYNVNIPSMNKIEINASWIINSSYVTPNNNSVTPSFTKCYVKLYDTQSSTYVASDTKNSNIGFIDYINNSSSSKTYRIDVVINGTKATGGVEAGSIVYNLSVHTHEFTYNSYNNTYHIKECSECGYHVYENHHYQVVGSNNVCSDCGHTVSHIHDYTYSYTWLNYNQHRAYCTCGNSHTELHVVSAKSLGDGLEYVTCILCGGPANAGIVPGMKGIQVTESGSFISPNGTLVLVDEDIDSYLSGEIVFEHEDVEITRNINIPPYIVRKDEYNEDLV